MMKRLKEVLLGAVIISVFLTACSGSKDTEDAASSGYSESYQAAKAAYPEEAAYEEYDMGAGFNTADYADEAVVAQESDGVLTDDPGSQGELESLAASDRKLIKTVNMEVETEDFDGLVRKVLSDIESLGGYPENTSINGNNYGTSSKRYAYITARIPADRLDAFTDNVAGSSNVISRNESIDDVTLNYVDMEAKKKSLKTEYERLNELIETAEDLETLILLEQRLSEVRYELESYESRLRTMDNQVRYSTVNVSIEEVVQYTPTPTHEETFAERIGKSFVNSCRSLFEGLKSLIVILVGLLPFLLVLGIIAVIILLIVKAAAKRSRKPSKRNRKPADRRINPGGYDPMTGKPLGDESDKTVNGTPGERDKAVSGDSDKNTAKKSEDKKSDKG